LNPSQKSPGSLPIDYTMGKDPWDEWFCVLSARDESLGFSPGRFNFVLCACFEICALTFEFPMMLISKLGEFGLIERFRKRIKTDASVIKGSGDDCAVLAYDKTSYQLFTCDMILEGVDFTLKDKPRLIGRKALAVQMSDIAACAGLPRHCLVSMGVSSKISLKFLDEVLEGMLEIAKEYKINIVGGDLSRSGKLLVDVSMLGVVEKDRLLLRGGSKPGDMIFVTGPLGGSIRGKHLSFTPRVSEARYLSKNFRLHSMIDISDGLVQDLGHILRQSGAGALLYEELIPVNRGSNLNEALSMGEDFELLFTLPREQARKLATKKPGVFLPIGEVVSAPGALNLVNINGRVRPLKSKGYTHF
jgi:thiamine-monophosphate kinase